MFVYFYQEDRSMKMKRIVALALAASLVASFAGCAKVKSISNDDFNAACEAQGAEEVDYDDMESDEDAVEDGVYCVLDSDDIEEIMSDEYTSYTLEQYDLSFDWEDVELASVFMKGSGIEDIDDISDPEDLADVEADLAVGIQITFSEDDKTEDFFNSIADAMDEQLDVNIDDLSGSEYYLGKNEGYLKINISAEDLAAAFLESELYEILGDMDEDSLSDVEEVIDSISGNICVASYMKGENLVVVIGAGLNSDTATLDSFCSDLGIASPSKVSANAELAQAIMDMLDDQLGSMLRMFSSYEY